MKSKNAILGLLAVVFAVGSAFASYDLATTAFIKVRYSTQSPGQFTCVNTGRTCSDAPTGLSCVITVSDLSATAPARKDNTCPAPDLKHTTTSANAGSYDDDDTIVEIVN